MVLRRPSLWGAAGRQAQFKIGANAPADGAEHRHDGAEARDLDANLTWGGADHMVSCRASF